MKKGDLIYHTGFKARGIVENTPQALGTKIRVRLDGNISPSSYSRSEVVAFIPGVHEIDPTANNHHTRHAAAPVAPAPNDESKKELFDPIEELYRQRDQVARALDDLDFELLFLRIEILLNNRENFTADMLRKKSIEAQGVAFAPLSEKAAKIKADTARLMMAAKRMFPGKTLGR